MSRFQSLWKESTSVVPDWPRDMAQLVGSYVCPQSDVIQYLDKTTLPREPKSRFHQLLSVKSAWDLDDIVPFLQDIVPAGTKIENFVLKYARKKKIGARIIVTHR